MSSAFKATESLQKSKGKGKKRADADASEKAVALEKKRKDKVLLLSSRGVTQRMRHLMADLEALLPHTKKGELWRLVAYRMSESCDLGADARPLIVAVIFAARSSTTISTMA